MQTNQCRTPGPHRPSPRALVCLTFVGLLLTTPPTGAQGLTSGLEPVVSQGTGGEGLATLSAYESPPEMPPAVPGPWSGYACDGTAWPANMVPATRLLPLPSVPSCGRSVDSSVARNVYLHSGEVFEHAVDLHIPGVGIDFVWARKYRSRLGPDTALGNGWDYSYNVWIETEGADVRLHDGHTRSDLYEAQGDGTYTRREQFQEGAFVTGSTFELTFPDGGTWTFQPLDAAPEAGRLASIEDRNGNTIALAYDTSGRLESITDTLGRVVTVAYGTDGHIESLTDFAGRVVVYEHYGSGDPDGSAGDLKSMTTPAVTGTSNGNNFPLGKTTTYTYSTGFSDDRLNHNLLTITDPSGVTFLSNVYDTETAPAATGFDRLERQIWGEPDDIIDLVYLEPGSTVAVRRQWAVSAPVSAVPWCRRPSVSNPWTTPVEECQPPRFGSGSTTARGRWTCSPTTETTASSSCGSSPAVPMTINPALRGTTCRRASFVRVIPTPSRPASNGTRIPC